MLSQPQGPPPPMLIICCVPELCSMILWRFSSASTELSNKRKALLLHISLHRAAAAGV